MATELESEEDARRRAERRGGGLKKMERARGRG